MVYFRVDMNTTIATGHIMRCLAIADCLRAKGEVATFITADDCAHDLLRARGYSQIILHSKWNCLDEEVPQMKELLSEGKNIVFVDHYFVTEYYLEKIREMAFLIYMDDLKRYVYPVDMLIGYVCYYKDGCYEQKYRNTKTQLLLGTEYAPLRKVFSNARRNNNKEYIKDILIISGGTDPYGIVRKFLNGINENDYNRIYAICGIYSKDYNYLRRKYQNNERITILASVNNIESYMSTVDLVISAGGTTLYELCAIGTPTISYTFADNQIENAKKFASDDIIPYAMDVRNEDVVSNIMQIISTKLYSKDYRDGVTKKMQTLVDGFGTDRITNQILAVLNG